MPFDYAEKIINEISSRNFRRHHRIKVVRVAENGEALLNNDLIRILRYIKSMLPYVAVNFFTNFNKFAKDKAELMLRERLIDEVVGNIDGSTNSNYFNVKRIELKDTKNNLTDFLEIRKKLNGGVPLTIIVLTLQDYIHTIYKNFGFYPSKLKDSKLAKIPDDFLAIKQEYERKLDSKMDRLIRSGVVGWAERERVDTEKIDYKEYSCTKLRIIKKEAFIAPDGTWYACCLDSNNELDLGNVIKQSVLEISFSKKRRELLRLLKERQFAKIGGPCQTVNCCQWLPSLTKEYRGL